VKPFLTLLASLVLLGAGAGATWLLRDHWADGPAPVTDADYQAFQDRLGGPEYDLRQELNTLAATATAPMGAADQGRAHGLTRECLDARRVLEIGHVHDFVAATGHGEVLPFHFLSEGDRGRVRAIVGDRPTADRVLALKQALAEIGATFAIIRREPDWNVKIEGEAPPMPYLNLMSEASQFRPGYHPELPGGAKVPAFTAAEVELVTYLDEFFNLPAAREAFPAKKFPLLYRGARLTPLPDLAKYKPEILDGIKVEKLILLPGEKTTDEQVAEVDEIFGRLERFFQAVAEANS
jgi:hypothetical protein